MPYITGERIVLRDYQYSDLSSMRAWVNDPEITDFLSDVFLYPHTEQQTESYLHLYKNG